MLPNRTILAILVNYFCEIILKSGHRPKRRSRLKVVFFFLLLALTAILFSSVEPF